MKPIIDVQQFIDNPKGFFMLLNEEEEKEFITLFEYFIYKHDIQLKKSTAKEYVITDILPKQVNEFCPLTRDEIYAK